MAEVVGNPIEVLRFNLRDEINQERKERRNDAMNRNRSALGQALESITVFTSLEEIVDVATRLKNSNRVSSLEMKKLKHAFLMSQENIAAFVNVPGALHALVTYLIGCDSEFRYNALNCCCNLALGNEKICFQITKASASYTVSALNDLNTTCVDICLWTLGNLAGSGMKSWSILKSQGVLTKYLHFLSSPNSDVTYSAVYATTMYVKTGFNYLTPSEFRMIADHAHTIIGKEPSVYWLIFLLTCSQDANQVFLMNMVVSSVFDLLINLVNTNKNAKATDVTALVRILANLCGDSKQAVSEIMMLLDIQSVDFLTAVNGLLASPHKHIQKETLWLLGNVIKHCPDVSDFVMSLEDRIKEALSRINKL